jgi:hypothetical protein
MTRDDAFDLRLRPGRIRDRGRASAPRARSFVDQVMRAAAKANGGPLTPAQMRSGKRRGGSAGKGRCCRVGRGQKAAEALKRAAGERPVRTRRVVVKARIVRHKLGSGAQAVHLRYLERDGTTRDGERGQLYGPETDKADRSAFVERGEGDRHSFRFIVAPEDGDRLSDLRAFTRDVMQQMEADLGTKLDWVAVDHFNTGHPHSMWSSAARTISAKTSSSPRTTSPTGCGCGRSSASPWSWGRRPTWSCARSSPPR